MIGYQQEQRSLTREQKEAVGLLSIGTFLEYFDLMLYVHMAVLLNELFFPKADPLISSLLSATAFCSTYIFRPVGALIFGWLGDNIGRKVTVVITTFMMAISCITMANLPTYAQIGISASIIITICRIVQGISSMGEVIGAELYLTETIAPPARYPAVAIISVLAALGGTAALGLASLVTSYGFNWRIAFWIGTVVALVGVIARTSLRETIEFADAKRQLKISLEKAAEDSKLLANHPIFQEKIVKKTSLAYFLMECSAPASFYFVYIYCANVLKDSFAYTAEQVIHQNFIVSLITLFSFIIRTYLSSRIYPLKILRVKLVALIILSLSCPYLLNNLRNSLDVFLLQAFVVLLMSDNMPATPIFYKHFPVFKRFTCATLTYALSRAFMYVVVSFGPIYLTKYFGHWGLLILFCLISLGFAFGLFHFERLEKKVAYP
ncbi:MFS transporter [Candidatus Tisiphia endosymbiont of Micropterix aruncella]|uniref:MFS transporter n=1 Tax=Candidatus Tisiphia endosymbiont of Micropterix aruncella TaxID=3066271 RepID=UPI003AA9241F